MNEFLKSILGSFNNAPDGASGKKLTALVCTIFCIVIPIDVWVYSAFKNNEFSLLTTILTIITSFILLLFGINEYGKSKNNDNEPKE